MPSKAFGWAGGARDGKHVDFGEVRADLIVQHGTGALRG